MARKKKYEEEIRKRWSHVKGDSSEGTETRFARAQAFIDKLSDSAGFVWKGLHQEGQESEQMMRTFFRQLADKLNLEKRSEPPSPKEVKEAIAQLKDVGRFSFFASFSLLPGGGALLIALELLAHKYGIEWFTFIPSAFREKLKSKKQK